jgi:hypothetical protein
VKTWQITAGVVLLTVVAGLFIFDRLPFADKSGQPGQTPGAIFDLGKGDGPPREFLYLDGARVDAYLSQFERGLSTIEKTSASKVEKQSAEVAASPAKLAREVQSQDVFERSVTPTTTSRMVNLLGYLQNAKILRRLPGLTADVKPSPRGFRAATRFLKPWRAVRQGDFVQLTGRVTVPRFGRLYQVVRQVPENSAAGRLGAKLHRLVGDDPRFPVAINVNDGRKPPVRLIMPLQFSLLASESSLIVGRLTVIGKVLYRVRPGGRPFSDLQTWTRFRPSFALKITPDGLLGRLNLKRRALKRELLTYKTVKGPAAVILPIAIYK